MISDVLSVVIIGLMVILVLYPASRLAMQTWVMRRSRPRLESGAPKPPR